VANEIFEFKLKTFRDQSLSHEVRDRAANWIIDRAFGHVPTPVEVEEESTRKIIYEVRWLPPDPNDRSNYVAPIR
jgi:hypothetical protein